MVFTNAEKQRRYRKRHLGVRGTKARGQFFLDADTRAQLGRLAHDNCTVTARLRS